MYGGKEATKVAYERDPANPRGAGMSSVYQFASNVGYPLEYDQQLEVRDVTRGEPLQQKSRSRERVPGTPLTWTPFS